MEIALISLALVASVFILTTRPITINYNKTFEVLTPAPQYDLPHSNNQPDELNENRPPTFDNMAAAMNQAFHDLGEENNAR